ncbi:MAG: hypothetical protein KDA61_11485, partial [Planctomycetales bacterium]|nr:hypothetical protein [Planctomycetales bacterium]
MNQVHSSTRRTASRRPAGKPDGRWGVAAGAAVALAVVCLGCQSTSNSGWKFAKDWHAPKMPWSKTEEIETELPQRVVATWTEAVHSRPGEKPKRGFGGRVVFFGDDPAKAVRVDGQLVVYAFDESTRADHDTAPTRRYVFPAEQFAKHESESQMGPTYSVWLPWDHVGGPSTKISLIARFEPRGGATLLSEQTENYLPGVETPTATMFANRTDAASGVQPASFQSPMSRLD